ncbi:hypothetical protein [Algihabitans sp.]|uniref:hypothetical protein n=1 Tax=Algihabitans sp. TaxID=2821514 RepID=UPI003BAA490D
MRYEIKRSIFQSMVLSACLGFSGVLFWLAVGEVDELCRLRTDGGGLYVLDDYGPDVRCDLRIGMVLLMATSYAVVLFAPLLFLTFFVRAVSRLVRGTMERRRPSAD